MAYDPFANRRGRSAPPSGTMVQYNPSVAQGRVASAARSEQTRRLPQSDWRALATAGAGSSSGGGDGEDKNILGRILGGAGSALGTAGKAIGYTQRAGVLGVEELAGLIPDWMEPVSADGEGFGGLLNAGNLAKIAGTGGLGALDALVNEDREDDRSNLDKLNDVEYGFGQIAEKTGNKWADRALGLVGDIAFDPLTYVTFGAGKMAGLGGRTAGTLNALGRVDDAELGKLARLGVGGVDEATRVAAFAGDSQAAKHGLRFMGNRIPGTGKPAELLSGAGARTRAAIGDALPTALQERRYTEGLEEAYRVMRSGDPGRVAGAATVIGSRNANATANANFTKLLAKGTGDEVEALPMTGDDLLRQLNKDGNAQEVFYALENGTEATVKNGPEARAWFNYAKREAERAGVEMGDIFNFVPNQWTDEAIDKMRGLEWAEKAARASAGDTAVGSVRTRTLQPGTYEMPGGRTVDLVADRADEAGELVGVSAKQINEKMAPMLGVEKVIDDDLSRVIASYTNGVSEVAGRVGRARYIDDLVGVDRADALEPKVQQNATEVQRLKGKARADRAVKGTGREFADTAKTTVRVGETVQRSLVDRLQSFIDDTTKAADAQAATAKNALGTAKNNTGIASVPAERAKAARALREVVAPENKIIRDADVALRQLDAEQGRALSEINQGAAAERLKQEALIKRQKRALGRGEEAAVPGGPRVYTEDAQAAKDAVMKNIDSRRAKINAAKSKATGRRAEAERIYQQQMDQIDAGRQAQTRRLLDARSAETELRAQAAEAKKLLAAARSARPASRASKAEQIKFLQGVEKDLNDVLAQVGDFPGSDELADLMTFYAQGVGRLQDVAKLDEANRLLRTAWTSGSIVPVIKMQVRDGFTQIGEQIMKDAPYVRDDVYRMMTNMDQALNDPNGLFKAVDEFTRFFKTYATMTPGFHVRNGMSATFMNAVAGVSPKNMVKGAKLWSKHWRNPTGWLDEMSEGEAKLAREAMDAVYGAGGSKGAFGDAELKVRTVRGLNKVSDNKATRFSRNVGEAVEGPARFALAYDTLVKGGTYEEAVANISRYQFDYSDLSKLDRKAKALIPFWTFMSRNLPLQLQEMALKPKVYSWYASLHKNMGGGGSPEDGLPDWWNGEEMQLGDGVFLKPDMPFASSALADLGFEDGGFDAKQGFAGLGLNPAIMSLVEGLSKEKFFTGGQIYDTKDATGVMSMLQPALQALGLGGTNADGGKYVEGVTDNTLRNLIPLIGQAGRLGVGGGDYGQQDNQMEKLAQYFGIPVTTLNDEQKKRNRERAGV